MIISYNSKIRNRSRENKIKISINYKYQTTQSTHHLKTIVTTQVIKANNQKTRANNQTLRRIAIKRINKIVTNKVKQTVTNKTNKRVIKRRMY